MRERIHNSIGGRFVEPRNGEWIDVVEPATGKSYAELAASSTEDVDDAVSAAREAFPAWSRTPAAERARRLDAIADGIERELDDFARAESIDCGKPIAAASTVDIPRAIANFRFFAGAVLHDRSELHETDAFTLNYTRRGPRGVAGLISPWNLPLYLLSWKIAPALATGNTVVAKPTELAPKTAAMLARVAVEAGLPPGVLNIVHGRGAAAGDALVAHPDVPAISFTGGTVTGRAIAARAAPMFKKLSLELGGKNPTVVFADCDLERAVTEGVRAAFSNQGQICLCGSRIFVERSLYERYVERFVEETKKLRVGDPLEPETSQGALISEDHRNKVEGYVDLAREEGGTVLCGGERPLGLPERCASGFFYPPTVVVDLPCESRVDREEIFGPVVSLSPFDEEDELIERANGTPYGLSASIWTSNLDRAHRLAGNLDVGTVWVNCWLVRDLRVPFGGMKQSGVGREGGREALRFFTEPKNVCLRLES